jgi:hypothetical protein
MVVAVLPGRYLSRMAGVRAYRKREHSRAWLLWSPLAVVLRPFGLSYEVAVIPEPGLPFSLVPKGRTDRDCGLAIRTGCRGRGLNGFAVLPGRYLSRMAGVRRRVVANPASEQVA